MNYLDGIHCSIILINFELMNLHEIMLTKYKVMSVKIKFILTYVVVYHRCFRLLLRIVKISVYYGSSDQFSFHKILSLREENTTVFLWQI